MRETRVFVQTLSALGIAAFLGACSNSGSSGSITPFGVVADSQTRSAQRAAGPDATVEYVYVTNSGDKSISAYKIDATSGALTPINGLFATGNQPDAIAIDPTGKFVYVGNSNSDNVSAYSINVTTGALKKVAGSPFGTGVQPYGVAVDPSGKFAYVANYGYGSNGNVSAYTINATSGALTPVFGSPFEAGFEPEGVVVDPKGKFAYVSNCGSGTVSAYKINAATGALKQVAGSPFSSGYGPQDLVVDSIGKFMYVASNGVSSSYGLVFAYQINATSGALSPVLGSPFSGGFVPYGIVDDPSGKFAYVTNELGNSVSAYKINPSSGALTQIFGSPFGTGGSPLSVTVDPTGAFAYVANYNGNDVSAYQINATSGALSPVSGSPFAAGSQPYAIAACRVSSGKCIPPPL
jgi:6-phosphogluconolactonase